MAFFRVAGPLGSSDQRTRGGGIARQRHDEPHALPGHKGKANGFMTRQTTAERHQSKRSTYGARATPSDGASVLPHVLEVACFTQYAPQGGMESLCPSPRRFEAGRHDTGAPDVGVLQQGGGALRGTHLGPVHGRVVPSEGYDLPGRERLPPRRGCHRGRGLQQWGQPRIVGDVRLPRDGVRDGASDPEFQQRRRGAVVVGTSVPTRGGRTPGGRPGAGGAGPPAIPPGLRFPVAAAMGVALRSSGRPDAGGGVSPAVTPALRVPVAAAVGGALRPRGRPAAGGGVSPAVTPALRVPVADAIGVALRPGGRPGAGGGVSPAVKQVLRAPLASTRGVAPMAMAAVGAPHGAVTARGSMAATVVLTGRRPRAVTPRTGTAADSALLMVPVVVAGCYGAAARNGRPPSSRVGAGTAGVVFMPLIGPATVMSRPETAIKGCCIPVPVGVGRCGRRGYAAGARARTRGTPCARLPFVPSGPTGAQRVDGRPRRGEGGWPSRVIRRGVGRGPRIGGPGLSRGRHAPSSAVVP